MGARAKSVTLCVGVNSDAYNRGLGVVVNANPSLDVTMNENGLPSYAYNGYGLQRGVRGNAIKFHPGMGGGEFRIEGKGGNAIGVWASHQKTGLIQKTSFICLRSRSTGMVPTTSALQEHNANKFI